VVAARACSFVLANGRPCRAGAMRNESYCFWHSPAHEEDAAEARRLGGLRRRREKTVSGAYDFAGLASVEAIRRILEIAIVDTLGLDNSLARARVLIAGAQAATRLLETGELEARIAALEAALGPHRPPPEPLDFEEAA
jgi:hypothetical protein